MGFVFFDTETTGLQFGFDQIVQFAAIRTDNDLNEIERFEIRSRLNPNVVPHPKAILTNGLSINQLNSADLPSHYEMMCSINAQLLSWSPSIFLGYNSIRFDEEMLRHALFQTLHPAFLTSCHGNGRSDVFGLALAAHASDNNSLNVTYRDDGLPSFKLKDIAKANGIDVQNAHDALSDTAVALAVCRHVRARSPQLWQSFVRFSNKAAVADFVGSEVGFILTEYYANKAYHTPVICIGSDPGQPNGRLCLNLASNIDHLQQLSEAELRIELSVKPCPIRKLRTNAAPTLCALWDAPESILQPDQAEKLEATAERVSNDHAFKGKLTKAFTESRTPFAEPRSVEEMLYTAFPSRSDEAMMASFHRSPWSQRPAIIQSLDDARLREFGLRLLGFEARSAVSQQYIDGADRSIANCLVDENTGRLTLSQSLKEVRDLNSSFSIDQDERVLLNDFQEYLMNRIYRVAQFQESVAVV
ncbi:exodeoxyribonuclease I [Rhodobacteraceae bacterium 4F10]|nr:exodeoxyribonuclease I [Rhodobacteraceae bacterium 4F10]